MTIDDTLASTIPRIEPSRAADTSVPYRVPVYIGCTILALVTNYLLGKDMAWDTLNYHLYAGFSAIHDRFAQDYFAAGPQSYFNPYIYVPFYLLVSAGLSALKISSVLAAVHSVILWLTYELAVTACPSDDKHKRLMFGLCGVALALANPVLLQQIGSTFADITTGELMLAGWLLLARAVRTPNTARVACAGLLVGAATALKPTNAVHAIAGFAVLIMVPLNLRGRLRQGVGYGISLGLAFLIISAPWSYRLEKMFGNPVFPLMNGVFRSPDFTAESMRHFRFIPATLGEALWRPFAMVDPSYMVHEEIRAPDIRYAVLVVLLIAFFINWLWHRRALRPSTSSLDTESASTRVLAALGCGLAVDWVTWLIGSGNSRYFLPAANVAAIVLTALVFRLFVKQPKVRNYFLAAIFCVQGVQLWLGTDYRWGPAPWDDQWLKITVPNELATEPSLYLTTGIQTNSFMAPFLNRGSGLVNIAGGYTLSPDGATGARIQALIKQYSPNIRVLLRGEKVYPDDERHRPSRSEVDDTVGPFGLRVNLSDCATIAIHGLPAELEITFATSEPVVPKSIDSTYMVSCRLVPDNTYQETAHAQLRTANLVLDRLEDACPALFQPRRPRTEYIGGTAVRRYINTDLIAWVSHGWVKFHQPTQVDNITYLGKQSEWETASLPISCGRRNGHFFANVVGSRDGS